MRIKVQHNGRESGPYSVSELRHLTERGDVCMMDWCWDHDRFNGILTVQQVLSFDRHLAEENVRNAKEKAEETMAALRQMREEEALRRVERAREFDETLARAKADLEDFKRRLEREYLREKELLNSARAELKAEQEAFFKARAEHELEIAHARDDLQRGKETAAEERRRLADHHKRHARNVAVFDERRRNTLASLSEEKTRLAQEAEQLSERTRDLERQERDLVSRKSDHEARAERENLHLVELRSRIERELSGLQEDKVALDNRREALAEQVKQAKLAAHEEKKRLSDLDKKLAADASVLDLQRHDLQAERKRLEEERRSLAAEWRELADAQRARPNGSASSASASGPRDERYFGRLLGLRGKVSFDEIKRAYRSAVTKCHPDKVQGLHPDIVALANAHIKDINEAFDFFRERYERRTED